MKTKRIFLATAIAGAMLAAAPSQAAPCIDGDGTVSTENTATILQAEGKYAFPTSAPKALVVFAHGYRNTSDSWVDHLVVAARDHQAVAVAMDYTGTGPGPSYRGMPLAAGAADTIKAAQYFSQTCNLDRVYLLGVSMGGAVSGLAVAEGPVGLFDHWIDVEGMVNITETYAEATAAAPSGEYVAGARDDIREETSGGSPVELARRTIVARTGDIAASGVDGVTVVHAVADGLVPYDQSLELVAALRAQMVPTTFFTIARRSSSETAATANGRSYNDEEDTTVPSYIPGSRPYINDFSGHAWEGSPTHSVMRTALGALWGLVDGGPYPTGSTVVYDGDTRIGN